MRNKNKYASNGMRNLKHLPYGYTGSMDYCRVCWYYCINKGGKRQRLKIEFKAEINDIESDWNKTKEYDKIGISVDELANVKTITMYKDSSGYEIKAGDSIIVKETLPDRIVEVPLKIKNVEDHLVVYNPKCCARCRDADGYIMTLDEALSLYEIELTTE